jgi:YbbR domain-containing protein
VNLITDDWRLKLLAIGLAVLMLGAVAFSQNPPTQKTLTNVSIGYTVGPDIIVINPPTKTTVTVTGLADALTSVSSTSVAASFDLTKVSPGPNVHVDLVVRSLTTGVQVQNQIVPQVLNIDRLTAVTLPVTVRTQRVTPGWQVTNAVAKCPNQPPTATCSVVFTGPSTWEANLAAFADFTDSVQQNSYDVLTQAVLLVQNGQPLDLTRLTEPPVRLDPSTVAIHIEAKTGTTTRQVTLIDAPPSHGTAPGYRVTDVRVDPITVVLNGPPEVLAKITTIILPPVDLSGATSTKTFQVAIPYPDNVIGSAALAKVTYTISANPNASPSP